MSEMPAWEGKHRLGPVHKDPVHTERCECGCTAIKHSLCFWLWRPGMDHSPIGACGSCEDCHVYIGPEDSKLISARDVPYLGYAHSARVYNRVLTNEEISARVMSLESDSPERRARASMRLSEEEPMRQEETGPPPMPVNLREPTMATLINLPLASRLLQPRHLHSEVATLDSQFPPRTKPH